jgi:hypothetical protein
MLERLSPYRWRCDLAAACSCLTALPSQDSFLYPGVVARLQRETGIVWVADVFGHEDCAERGEKVH